MKLRLNLNQVRIIITILSVAVLAGGVGYQLGVNSTFLPVQKGSTRFNLDLFWKTWDLLNEKFYYRNQLDPRQAVYGAIAGLVASAGDPYTVFLDPVQNDRMQEDIAGSFGGIGVHLDYIDGQIGVVSPLKGYPAETAGIRSRDIILAVDETDLYRVSLPEVVNMIRGPVGQDVILTVLSEGELEPRKVSVEREVIDVPSLELEFETDWCGSQNCSPVVKLSLNRFGDQTQREWLTAVDEIAARCHLDSSCVGIILDLRGNPGGYLEDSVFVASEFLDSGVVFYQEEAGKEPAKFEVNRRGRLIKEPLVVLVDRGSASASEIVAGALQHHGRALLLGETTFGKGSIQEPLDLEAGAGIHITVARWLLPGMESVDGIGLIPDIEVEMLAGEVDQGMESAVELITERSQ